MLEFSLKRYNYLLRARPNEIRVDFNDGSLLYNNFKYDSQSLSKISSSAAFEILEQDESNPKDAKYTIRTFEGDLIILNHNNLLVELESHETIKSILFRQNSTAFIEYLDGSSVEKEPLFTPCPKIVDLFFSIDREGGDQELMFGYSLNPDEIFELTFVMKVPQINAILSGGAIYEEQFSNLLANNHERAFKTLSGLFS